MNTTAHNADDEPGDDAPPGFVPTQGSGFVPSIGAIYVNHDRGTLGARIRAHHLNPLGFAHGGLLATLIDTSFGMTIRSNRQTELPPVTICLNVEYLSPAYPGDWIEAQVDIQKAGKRITNASCKLMDGDRLIAKGNAVFIGASGVKKTRSTPNQSSLLP